MTPTTAGSAATGQDGPRVAMVTGATRNIGRATALRLARQGHDVIVHGRTESDNLLQVCKDIESLGRRAWPVTADFTDSDGGREAAERGLAAAGRIDVMVNNAAARPHMDFLELSRQVWLQVVDVILYSAVACSQVALPGMVERGWGRIVNVIGVRGQVGGPRRPGRAQIVAAKSGLVGLTRVLSHEYGPAGVTVNAVSPGTIVTDRDLRDDWRLRAHADLGVLGHPGQPEDVAAMIAFLASADAGHVTGQTVGVNGGEYMG